MNEHRLEDVDRSAKHQLEEYLSAARRAQEESTFLLFTKFERNCRKNIILFNLFNQIRSFFFWFCKKGEHKVKLEQDKLASGQRRIADLEQDLQIQRNYFFLRFQ